MIDVSALNGILCSTLLNISSTLLNIGSTLLNIDFY
jgi:hypothetical protein